MRRSLSALPRLALAAAALGTLAAAPLDRYQLTSEVARDTRTGLAWQRSGAANTFTWPSAVTHCENLLFAGQSDWRLPTVKELQTLVDEDGEGLAIDATAFPGTPAVTYWSSSPVAAAPDHAWGVRFDGGVTVQAPAAQQNRVRCVRDAAP